MKWVADRNAVEETVKEGERQTVDAEHVHAVTSIEMTYSVVSLETVLMGITAVRPK